jgi:hypothetical protein
MNEKLVLPRFNVPGDGTHGAVRALWVTGTLVVLATLILGLAMWRHRAIEVANAEEAAAKVATARRAALMPAPAPAPPVKMQAIATGSALGSAGGDKMVVATTPAAATGASSDVVVAHAPARVRHHSGKSHASARAPSAEGRPARKANAGSNDDVIDRLLRQ